MVVFTSHKSPLIYRCMALKRWKTLLLLLLAVLLLSLLGLAGQTAVPGERPAFSGVGRMAQAGFADVAVWFGWWRSSPEVSEAAGRRSEQISRWCSQDADGSIAAWDCNWMPSTADNQRSAEFSIQSGKEEATGISWHIKCKKCRRW